MPIASVIPWCCFVVCFLRIVADVLVPVVPVTVAAVALAVVIMYSSAVIPMLGVAFAIATMIVALSVRVAKLLIMLLLLQRPFTTGTLPN